MTTSLTWHPLPPSTIHCRAHRTNFIFTRHVAPVQAFSRSDFDGFARRLTSGESWRDAWRSANNGFEQLLFETRKAAERIDRKYSVSRRFTAAADTAVYRARELDREFEITRRWRSFSLDFSSNWPRYREQFNDCLDTPLGRSFGTIFFLWFALSGWLFRFLMFATLVLPFAGPLLIGAVANNVVVKGSCPSCRRQFVGYKSQRVRCASCRNIVWQPQDDLFSGGPRGTTTSSKSRQDIIDVEFEEK